VAVCLGVLIVLCHGAYVTWKEDTESAVRTLAEVTSDRDALRAEKTALKPIPSDHVVELKEMLQRAQRSVQHHAVITYGDGQYENEPIFRESFNTHFSDLSPLIVAWEAAREQSVTLNEAVKGLAIDRTNNLIAVGVQPQAWQWVIGTIERVASGQEPYPNNWTGYEMQGPGTFTIYWNGQEVISVAGGREAADAATAAFETLLTEAPQWPQVLDYRVAAYELDSLTHSLVNELAQAHARHMTHTVNLCGMCPQMP
jgi:hypothetical protein